MGRVFDGRDGPTCALIPAITVVCPSFTKLDAFEVPIEFGEMFVDLTFSSVLPSGLMLCVRYLS